MFLRLPPTKIGSDTTPPAAPKAQPEPEIRPRLNRKAVATSLDCSEHSTQQIEALQEMDHDTRQAIRILNCTNNNNLTNDILTHLFVTFPNLTDIHLEGSSVQPQWQENTQVFLKSKSAMIVFDLPIDTQFSAAMALDGSPCFFLQHKNAIELQAFIDQLKNPANQDHVAMIQRISFSGNTSLTDELFDEIICLLPNVRAITAGHTKITKLPESLTTREYLQSISCDECEKLTNHNRPAGLRDDVRVDFEYIPVEA